MGKYHKYVNLPKVIFIFNIIPIKIFKLQKILELDKLFSNLSRKWPAIRLAKKLYEVLLKHSKWILPTKIKTINSEFTQEENTSMKWYLNV